MEVADELVKAIEDENCVIFVGAGLSSGAGLPDWKKLLKMMLDWAAKKGRDVSDREELEKGIKDGDLLMVAEELRDRLGNNGFREFMKSVFRKPVSLMLGVFFFQGLSGLPLTIWGGMKEVL